MPPPREEPINIDAASPPADPSRRAALIFLHGLGDDAHGFENIAHQFQRANKLPHLTWVFPNALENHDAMQKAWYTPTPLSPFASQRPELDDPEDEEGLLASVAYVETLIAELIDKQQIPVERIVIGGFSQGCAVSLLAVLVGAKFAGRVGGVLGLAGYLPLGAERIGKLMAKRRRDPAGDEDKEVSVPGRTPIFYMRGSRDMAVPQRYYRMCVEGLKELGFAEEQLTAKLYEGVGHTVNGEVLRDVCTWLENIVPP